jgi:hypothetical protein
MPAAVLVVAGAVVLATLVGQRVLPDLSFFQWGDLISSIIPALLVLLGVYRMRRSRLEAYRTFKTAVLLIIFVTQFFAFYHQQLLAMFGLLSNIVVWLTLRTMIQQEERLACARGAQHVGGAALATTNAGRRSTGGADGNRRTDGAGESRSAAPDGGREP